MKLIDLFEEYDSLDSEEYQNAIELIKTNCSKFLAENDTPLWRGVKSRPSEYRAKISDVLVLGTSRQDRQPLSASKHFSKLMDEYFVSKTGIPYRSQGIFTTFNISTARGYGVPHLFFPIGNYHYTFSEYIDDAWGEIETEPIDNWPMQLRRAALTYIENNKIDPSIVDLKTPRFTDGDIRLEILMGALKSADLYQFDKNIGDVSNQSNEIMFSCNKYYILDISRLTAQKLYNML
jgi:hypothetical protein